MSLEYWFLRATTPRSDMDDDSMGCINEQDAWAHQYFGYCVHNRMQLASLFCGLLSIAFSMGSGLPQLYQNWRRGEARSLSWKFLLGRLIGDVAGLLGVILTLSQHVVTQLYIAVYFVVIDGLLFLQFVIYRLRHKRKKRMSALLFLPIPPLILLATTAATTNSSYTSNDNNNELGMANVGRVLSSFTAFSSTTSIIGYTLGWVSGLMYFTSRLPQIRKNYRRKTTHGLAISMFVMAVLGNTCYTLSVLLKRHTVDYIVSNLPWLLGSGGTLFFDFFIFAQFLYYGSKPPLVQLRETQALLSGADPSESAANSYSKLINEEKDDGGYDD